MDIKKFIPLVQFDVHVKFGFYQNEGGGQWIMRLDDFAEFVVPADVEARCKATPGFKMMEPVTQFQLLLKLLLEKSSGEWQ